MLASTPAGPYVSVIIPTYNRAELLIGSVESVLSQTFTDLEIVVVDDGSTDGTVERLALIKDSRVRVVKQAHFGVSRARNVGVDSARGRFIAFQDSDDIWLPTKLAAQLQLLEQHPDVGWVYCDFEFFGSDDANLRPSAFALCAPYDGSILRDMIIYGCPIATPTVVVRSECLREVGGFDESFTLGEDKDMWFRLASRFRVSYIAHTLVKVRRSNDRARRHDRLISVETRVKIISRILEQSVELKKSLSRKEYYRACDRNYFELAYAALARGDREVARHWLGRVPIWRYPVRTLAYYGGALAPNLFLLLHQVHKNWQINPIERISKRREGSRP